MAITDLTGTSWVLNLLLDTYLGNISSKNINFISNGNNYNTITYEGVGSSHTLSYGNTTVWYENVNVNDTWSDPKYRIIYITDGADVTNATLIAWLQNNATLVPVVDLTDTTWIINSLTAESGYGEFNINCDNSAYLEDGFTFYQFNIGYRAALGGELKEAYANRLCLSTINPDADFDSYKELGVNGDITFTSGTDIANPDLIVWLTLNAELQSEETEYTLRINGVVTDEYNGHKIRYLTYNGIRYKIKEAQTPDSYFDFTLLSNNTYEIKAHNVNNIPSNVILPSSYNGKSVTSIGYEAFPNCYNLTSVTIPDSITSIGERAFFGCYGLTNITIPNSVMSIGRYAFFGCNLTRVVIGNSVTSIGWWAFAELVNLTSVEFTENSQLGVIGANAFRGCALTSITIPDSVTSINGQAFYYCSNLTSVTIGEGVTSIGMEAFRFCSGLTSITVKRVSPPRLTPNSGTRDYVFDSTGNCPIYVPAESVEAYKNAWNYYASRIQATPTHSGGGSDN